MKFAIINLSINQKLHKPLLPMLLIFALCFFFIAGLPLQVNASASQPLDYSSVFDAAYYYSSNPDLQQNIGNDASKLLNHFITTGMKEGRAASPSFDVKAYMRNNLDLLPVYGVKDLSAYYIHYLSWGKAEGRKSLFDSSTSFISGAIASYSTAYDSTEDRAVNIELAAAHIDGTILQPGDSFSFSNSVKSRTLGNGYVVAPSIANGKLVTSVGGGICQVSSSLYVAMLLSEITPTEHYSHSLMVDYVPIGLDSAIAEGYKDLKFRNPFDYPIIVNALTENNVLTVSFSKNSTI